MKKQTPLELLQNVLALRSVSGQSEYEGEIAQTTEYLAGLLRTAGCTVEMVASEGVPALIIATYLVSESAPTIGIYGHYDVQSPDPLDEWTSDPFQLTERDGRLFGRGVADNKGHIIQNIVAVSELIERGKLQNNIVFILEGEEESGSPHFEELTQKVQDILQSVDLFLITDTGMDSKATPQMYYALRGLVYAELHITTASRDLHSGIYGNVIANPATILTEILSSMKNSETGEILIEGFYDDVRTPGETEMDLLKKAVTSPDDLKRETGSDAVRSIRELPPYLTSKILPSLDINGMQSGFTGEGSKTIIPRTAFAKFSTRLVEHQDTERIKHIITAHIEKRMPEDVHYQIIFHSSNAPFYTDFQQPLVQQVARVLENSFGNPVRYNRSGGSIPAAEILQRLFGKPVVLTGFTLPDDNIHAPNENIDKELFTKGIAVLKNLYSQALDSGA